MKKLLLSLAVTALTILALSPQVMAQQKSIFRINNQRIENSGLILNQDQLVSEAQFNSSENAIVIRNGVAKRAYDHMPVAAIPKDAGMMKSNDQLTCFKLGSADSVGRLSFRYTCYIFIR